MTGSRSPHDLGGTRTGVPIPRDEHERADWESLADAVRMALSAKGLLRMDEIRRATEELGRERYSALSYYGRRVAALEAVIVRKQLLSADEISRRAAELEPRK